MPVENNSPHSPTGDYAEEIAILVGHLSRERACSSAILDTTNALILVLDHQGRVERFSRAYEEISRCAFDEAAGKFWWEIIRAPEEAADQRGIVERLGQLPPEQFPFSSNATCFNRAGETRRIFWTFTAIPDEDGAAQYFVGVGQDRTEQLEVEDRFARIFYGSPVPIAITTLEEGRFLFANDAILRMFGYSRDEFIGRTAVELGLWHNPAEREAVAAHLRLNERIHNVSLQGRHKGGHLRFSLASFERIEMDGMPCVLCVAVDVTEQHALQENVRALAEGISNVSSGAFFESSVRHLAGILGVSYVFIGELVPGDNRRVRTVAQFHNGEVLDNIEYDLANTPCENIVNRSLCVFTRDVQHSFPDDIFLTHINAQSYVGTPLFSAEGQPLGLLSVIDEQPLEDSNFVESVLRVFGTRVAAELERRRAEDALRAGENRYRALAEGSAVGIWHIDLEGFTIYINPAMCRMLELESASEMEGRNFREFFTAESLSLMSGEHARRFAGEKSSYEAEMIGRQGGRHDVLISGAPLLGADGKVAGFIGTFLDVTERKRADLALRRAKEQLEAANGELERANSELEQRVAARTGQLRESEERLRQITDNIPYVIWVCEKDFETVTYMNPAFDKVWGIPGSQIISGEKRWDEVIVPEDREAVQAFLESVKSAPAEGNWQAMEYRIRRPDGEMRWIRDRVFPIRNSRGEISRYAGVAQDITERHHIEESLRAAHTAAEHANQSKSEFLSRMSHEFRTPLNAILGFAQLLEMDAQTAEQSESVEQILRAGRHLLGMINEVLDISRIESGYLSLSMEPVCVIELASECLSLVRPLAAQRNVSLLCPEATTGEHQCEFVLGDRGRLRQVLLNYLSNAVKYNHEGGEVCLFWEEVPSGRLRVAVSDKGPGIPAEKMPLLFVPFERLGAESTEVGGSGLGLALCKRLIEAQDGTVGVDSIVGQGSTFWFLLPRVATQAANSIAIPEVAAPEPPANGDVETTRTVLYIEDNPSNSRLMERLLKQRPYVRLLGAKEGYEGLRMAREHQPDLILLDLQLPDLPGDEVLQELKRDPRLRHVPVLVISADATRSQVQKILSAGAVDYLTKPLDLRRCLQSIDELLEPDSPSA